MPDEEIVRLLQETGDRECFAELFVRHRKKVFFAGHRFFSNGPAAEDATQETFLRAYLKIHSFRGGDFASWLMRIARNVCIDEWRKGRLEREIVDSESAETAVAVAPAPSFEAEFAVERFWQEMRSLPPEQQRCLQLKIEGYSYEETAARTGLSVEAVKSHLQNGRRMLWKRMEGALVQAK